MNLPPVPTLNPTPEGTPTRAITRRDFLILCTKGLLAASGLIGAGGLARFLGYQGTPTAPVEFDLGSAAGYPLGSRTVLPEAKALLIHDAKGFRALSLTCTHLGCEVKPTESGFACPCHGSLYDPDGKVLRGPAGQPLHAGKIEQAADGRLILRLPQA